MYGHVCVCVCVCVYIYTYIYIYMCVCVSTYMAIYGLIQPCNATLRMASCVIQGAIFWIGGRIDPLNRPLAIGHSQWSMAMANCHWQLAMANGHGHWPWPIAMANWPLAMAIGHGQWSTILTDTNLNCIFNILRTEHNMV